MTQTQKTTALTAAAVALTLVVAACGGGGDDNVAGSDVSVRATQDSGRAFSFTAGLADSSNETGEPIVLGDAQLATSETDEPAPI
ncbi:MAG: hypothetical protein V4738_07535 [Pseudomonadota bacterium]